MSTTTETTRALVPVEVSWRIMLFKAVGKHRYVILATALQHDHHLGYRSTVRIADCSPVTPRALEAFIDLRGEMLTREQVERFIADHCRRRSGPRIWGHTCTCIASNEFIHEPEDFTDALRHIFRICDYCDAASPDVCELSPGVNVCLGGACEHRHRKAEQDALDRREDFLSGLDTCTRPY